MFTEGREGRWTGDCHRGSGGKRGLTRDLIWLSSNEVRREKCLVFGRERKRRGVKGWERKELRRRGKWSGMKRSKEIMRGQEEETDKGVKEEEKDMKRAMEERKGMRQYKRMREAWEERVQGRRRKESSGW